MPVSPWRSACMKRKPRPSVCRDPGLPSGVSFTDTNRWDRASGLTPGRYGWSAQGGQRVRTGSAKELGFEIEWVEPPYEWVEGRFVHGERRFSKGPVARGGFHARLRDLPGGGTLVTAVAYVAGSGALMPLLGPIMKRKFAGALARYLDGLGEVLSAPTTLARPPSGNGLSATLFARDLIAERPYDALTQGAARRDFGAGTRPSSGPARRQAAPGEARRAVEAHDRRAPRRGSGPDAPLRARRSVGRRSPRSPPSLLARDSRRYRGPSLADQLPGLPCGRSGGRSALGRDGQRPLRRV